MKEIEWFGAITGLIGALLLALNLPLSKWAFVLYAVSNIAWIAFSMYKKLYGMLTQQLGFMVVNILGLFRWF